MKKIVPFLLLLLCVSMTEAQVEKYHRVRINASTDQLQKLLHLGITIDHSQRGPTGLETEISDHEVRLLANAHIPYEILISDLTAYYQERNRIASAQKENTLPNCNYPFMTSPSHFHLGSMGGFFTLSEMENILDSMQLLYPGLITVKQPISSIQSIEGRNIWYVKISDNPTQDENEPEVLYTALHHAREPQSLSQLIYFMWYLLENYNNDAEITNLIDNRELYFVPCINPDGYVYNEVNSPAGGGMWRKNRRLNADSSFGVDLNRNYAQDWGYDNFGSSPNPANDTYRGTAAFSEPETQAIQDFCNSRQFVNALNAHSFGNHLIYPWGHIPSSYTPDKNSFEAWGHYLVREHRFSFGTCNETLNYVTNGDSDAWMYGEQTSKGKIMAMTPETGGPNDGFWPAANRIEDLCKSTFAQNLKLARLAGNCMVVKDQQDKFLSGNGYLKYSVQRLGLASGSSTVSIVPIGSGFSSVGAAKIYNNLSPNQEVFDSISYTLQSGLNPAQLLKYSLRINNEGADQAQVIAKIHGSPQTLFYNDGNNTNNFDLMGTWGIYTNSFVSGPSCITESPAGNYSFDEHKSLTTKSELDLTSAVSAQLQYYTRFQVEKSYDQVVLEVSTNNGASFSPLCASYETPPVTFGGSDPVYDGRQDVWAKEEIDLYAYLGQKIKLRIRFDSDFYDERDGFYVDDFLVRIIQNTSPVGTKEQDVVTKLDIYPNPGDGLFYLRTSSSITQQISVYNQLGQCVLSLQASTEETKVIDLREQAAGLYFIKLQQADTILLKKVVVTH